MKNLIIALAIVGFTYSSAEAQSTEKICPAPKGKVCRKGGSCYKTKFAYDFKVCKGDYGYFICCEEPTYSNSTHPRVNMVSTRNRDNGDLTRDEFITMNSNGITVSQQPSENDEQQKMIAPQSQSYPEYAMNTATSYEGYYSNKGRHYIKVCYGGDNVAELNAAAYHGCPTPAYDGPQANKARNVNSNNVIDNIAPITGQSK
ncbi:MAG: hypothetical protein JWQ38_3253 [Flavipsychrobacter sp.]|nr:hypothetical protein [Flavipsychrobacter sp.]